MKKITTIVISLLQLLLISSCTHLESGGNVKLAANDQLVLLPLQNQAETPRAGKRVEQILQSMLHNRGITKLVIPPTESSNDLALLLDDTKRQNEATAWAGEQNFKYGITGSVQEWRYKTGLDGEPAVGITLTVIDLKQKGLPIWTATASRTGWGAENLTEATTQVIKTLLGEMQVIQ